MTMNVPIIVFRLFLLFAPLMGLKLSASETCKTTDVPQYYKKYTLSLGHPDAPVQIEEMFSFLCPSCLLFHTHHFPKLKKEFIDTGKVRWTYIPYLMDLETLYVMSVLYACTDALKATLFENLLAAAKNWKDADNKAAVTAVIKSSSVPEKTIQHAFSKKNQDAVLTEGAKFKESRFVDGTPTFFMDGKEIEGVPSAEKLSQLIRTQLKKQVKP